jgi:hypothetical protein
VHFVNARSARLPGGLRLWQDIAEGTRSLFQRLPESHERCGFHGKTASLVFSHPAFLGLLSSVDCRYLGQSAKLCILPGIFLVKG